MKYIPDAAQMKAADQYTIETLQVPSLMLMERAALSCVDVMKEKKLDLSNVCVVCGSGNNGGDGFAIARILTEQNIKVTVVMAGNPNRCTQETAYQMKQLEEAGVSYVDEFQPDEYSLIVDSIFGVGLSREITGNYKTLIDTLNESSAIRFAVDIPSGISADHGNVLGVAFKADYTVTFQAAKTGLLFYPGKEYAGEVIVKDIGISEEYFENDSSVSVIYEHKDYQNLLPERKEDSHKGSYGKILVIAGSKGMSGAAYLNAYAAYMSGAGLVQIYTSEDNRIILQQLLPEAIITTYEDYEESKLLELVSWADTICIGSGIGLSDVSRKILKTIIFSSEVPCVIDADGLNILAKHMWYLKKKKHDQYILTPHMKEMSRLIGMDVLSIKENRKSVMDTFTNSCGITCVLKDSVTAICDNRNRMVINTTGNQAMAKAGAGDVLAGIIAGILAQTKSCHTAAVLGVYLHGRCGDEARKQKGSYSVLARDLIDSLSIVLKGEEG